MTILRKTKLALAALLAVSTTLVSSAVIIKVGEFDSPNSGDATEHALIRSAIDIYNTANNPDLPLLFSTGTPPSLLSGWVAFQPKSSSTPVLQGYFSNGDEKILSFTAPGTYTEYYVFSKYGQGQANFDSALHYMNAGDVLIYNPGGNGAPQGLSHIAIWARNTSDTPSVPDSGSAVALLGAALVAVAALRRRKA